MCKMYAYVGIKIGKNKSYFTTTLCNEGNYCQMSPVTVTKTNEKDIKIMALMSLLDFVKNMELFYVANDKEIEEEYEKAIKNKHIKNKDEWKTIISKANKNNVVLHIKGSSKLTNINKTLRDEIRNNRRTNK